VNAIAKTATTSLLTNFGQPEWDTTAHISPQKKEFLNINLGKELAKYRGLKGLGESEIAEKLGVSANYVRLIEWGLIRNVSTKMRRQIIDMVHSR